MSIDMKKVLKDHMKLWSALAFAIVFAGLMLFLFSGDNLPILKALFTETDQKEDVRDSLSQLGWRGYITVGILAMLQVVLTFLPAEPVQVVSGIAFGFLGGFLACLAGVIIGNTVVFLLYRIYGQKLTEYFSKSVEFDFDIARRSKKVAWIIFILYFLPAIPYGMICLFAASLGIRYPRYIILTVLGSIPSIVIGVELGDLAIEASLFLSIGVFVVLLALLAVLVHYRSAIFKKLNAYMAKKNEEAKVPKKPKLSILIIADQIARLLYRHKVKLSFKKNVKKLERPSLVLCNHCSFYDFFYAGRIIREERPNFLAARLYFYHKWLGRLMRAYGCVPKSMFTADLENAKNCLRMLANNRVIAMMPEARLSTVGRFEGIQDSTYEFIRKSGVTVYTVRVNGNYFAGPKWGDGIRRGSFVELELSPLFAAGETKELTAAEVKERVEAVLAYDEFAWLAKHPEISYRSKTLAEGLENILYLCPQCKKIGTMTTKGHTLRCEACGMETAIDDRYAFVDKKPFENFAEWYEFQTRETAKQLAADPDFAISSKVELRHSSKDGKEMTRHAGEGVCTLDRTGLTYRGTRDGEEVEKHFPLATIYRILFGAGVDFEIYEGKEIWFFVPENKRTAVLWYVVSGLLKEESEEKTV